MAERFMSQLTSSEQIRVKQLIDILYKFPMNSGDWLWAVGTGSVARMNPDARDIDIAIWTKFYQAGDLRAHLEGSFREFAIDYQFDGHFYGLPRLVRKDQRWSSPTGRAIEINIATINGISPETIIEGHTRIPNQPVVELLQRKA